jgi:hypothetical protein
MSYGFGVFRGSDGLPIHDFFNRIDAMMYQNKTKRRGDHGRGFRRRSDQAFTRKI